MTKIHPTAAGRTIIRYIDIGSIDGLTHSLREVSEFAAADAPGRARQIVETGDTLFSTVRPYLEKIAAIGPDLNREFASTGFCVLRPGPRLHPRWLFHFATSPALMNQVLPQQRGVSYPAVRDKDVLRAKLPLPDRDEQRRIVEILDDHLSRLDAAAGSLRLCQQRAQAWRRSTIDRVVWNGSREVAVADLLAEKMRNGHSARASTTGAGIRCLTLTSVTRNDFADAFTKVVGVEEARVEDLWLRDGDILVQRSNTPDLVGTTAIYRGPDRWAIFPDLLIRLRADERRVSSAYLAAAMRTERVHRTLRAQARGLAGSMPKIDQSAIASVRVPLPSLAAQDDIVGRIAEIEASHSRLAAGLEAALRRVGSLRRSLLADAFSGRLVA